ncbi:MAG: AI-2E family transporter, partial [Pararhodobacter sp.]
MGSEHRIRTDTILLTAGLLLLGYLLGEVLLLVFAAVLLAVGLDGAGRAISQRVPVGRGWAVVVVSVAILALVIGAFTMTATRLVEQFQALGETVFEFVERSQAWLSQQGVTGMMEEMDLAGGGLSDMAGNVAGHVMTFGLSAFGAITSTIILLVLAVFLVADPALYRGGLLRLVPPESRYKADDTLAAIAHALRWWFLGQLASMVLLGVTVGLGLFVMGIELWFALA